MMAGLAWGIPPKEATDPRSLARRAVFEEFQRRNPGIHVVNAGGLQLQENAYRYAPYAGAIQKTGSASDPSFTWAGAVGYRSSARLYQEFYVRARHYSSLTSSWTSFDPIWPREHAFSYTGANPVARTDRSGLACTSSCYIVTGCRTPSDCERNTNLYDNSFLHTGNKFECCASCVSKFICQAIQWAQDCARGSLWPDSVVCGELAQGLACQNNCMADHWRKKDTPLWQNAKAICNAPNRGGQTGFECCKASVLAEQDAYDRCAAKCGLTGSLLALLPYSLRIKFALDVLHCCS